jgi:GNAT superfamily N-acetyltransferase
MNNFYEAQQGDYLISTNPSLLQVTIIHEYLSERSYWAQNIPLAVVQKAINNSLCFGLFHQNKQVGFARLVTDMATFACLCDVFIVEEYRGKGLSKWLMQTIHAHPELQYLRGWHLRTKDAHGLYEQFGWQHLTPEAVERTMCITNRDVYNKMKEENK